MTFQTTAEVLRYVRENTDFVYCQDNAWPVTHIDDYIERCEPHEEYERENDNKFSVSSGAVWTVNESGYLQTKWLDLFLEEEVDIND